MPGCRRRLRGGRPRRRAWLPRESWAGVCLTRHSLWPPPPPHRLPREAVLYCHLLQQRPSRPLLQARRPLPPPFVPSCSAARLWTSSPTLQPSLGTGLRLRLSLSPRLSAGGLLLLHLPLPLQLAAPPPTPLLPDPAAVQLWLLLRSRLRVPRPRGSPLTWRLRSGSWRRRARRRPASRWVAYARGRCRVRWPAYSPSFLAPPSFPCFCLQRKQARDAAEWASARRAIGCAAAEALTAVAASEASLGNAGGRLDALRIGGGLDRAEAAVRARLAATAAALQERVAGQVAGLEARLAAAEARAEEERRCGAVASEAAEAAAASLRSERARAAGLAADVMALRGRCEMLVLQQERQAAAAAAAAAEEEGRGGSSDDAAAAAAAAAAEVADLHARLSASEREGASLRAALREAEVRRHRSPPSCCRPVSLALSPLLPSLPRPFIPACNTQAAAAASATRIAALDRQVRVVGGEGGSTFRD